MVVRDTNKGFDDYDFGAATRALYNFFLYELCDVYFESLKPVAYGENEEAKVVSRNVLYPVLIIINILGVDCRRFLDCCILNNQNFSMIVTTFGLISSKASTYH